MKPIVYAALSTVVVLALITYLKMANANDDIASCQTSADCHVADVWDCCGYMEKSCVNDNYGWRHRQPRDTVCEKVCPPAPAQQSVIACECKPSHPSTPERKSCQIKY